MAHDSCNHQHHGHEHDNSRKLTAAFIFGIILNLSFVIIEFLAGYISNSNALLADAGHNLFDVLGLFVAWFGFYLAQKKQQYRLSAGISLVNALGLVIAVLGLGYMAIIRFSQPAEINTAVMITVAMVGIFINFISAYKFKTHQHDLNVQGAYLHLMADAAISLGVVVSGFAIRLTGYSQIDSIVTIVICATILITSLPLIRKSFSGLLVEL